MKMIHNARRGSMVAAAVAHWLAFRLYIIIPFLIGITPSEAFVTVELLYTPGAHTKLGISVIGREMILRSSRRRVRLMRR